MSKTKDKILFTGNEKDYSPTQSESYKKAGEEAKQNAIDKAEENFERPSVRKVKEKESVKTLFNSIIGNNSTNEANNTTTNTNTFVPSNYSEIRRYIEEQYPTSDDLIKKEKREMRLAKISDGISAIANLIATTKGAQNSFTGENTRTENTRKKWDEFYKKREEEKKSLYDELVDAMKTEEAIRYRNKKDEEEKERYENEIAHRNEREKIADDRYTQEQNDKKEREKIADDRYTQEQNKWRETFEENKRRFNESIRVREEEVKARAIKGVRGKQLGFVDGSGNQVSIYENVWKGSMQQVYDVLYEDMVKAYNEDKNNNPRVPKHKTQKEKDDFVKQNWHKSPRASQIMLTLSTIDPATMTSEINDDSNQSLGWGNPSNNTTDW